MRLILFVHLFMALNLTNGAAASDGHARFAHDLVRSAFAADTLCLGPHWIYDTDRIAELYPDGLSGLDAPRSEYHPGKTKGDFTHYGDQSLVLLESIAKRQSWVAKNWLEDWAAFWASNPESYLDGATRDTLDNLAEGKGMPSSSHDLAGVSRMAPVLAYVAAEPVETWVEAAREQTGVTHGDPHVLDAAEFFARAIFAIKSGASYSEAFETAIESGSYSSSLEEEFAAAKAKAGVEISSAAQNFGQSCAVEKAFPLTIWTALAYEDQPVAMLEQNALAGGDSSARGMLLGMLIAASGKFDELPAEWTTGQTAAPRIDAALSKLLD